MDLQFWKNKNVLITGYEGFLGSHLSKKLLELKANLYGLDILVYRKNTILTKEDLNKIHIIKGSVEDYSLLLKIIRKNKINIVFHLAAKSLVADALNNPCQAFSTNIQGTWNLLEACRNHSQLKAIIVASSDKAYGEQKKLPYREDSPLMGNHPYDVSKSCADLIANAYYHTYQLPLAISRCGNIYGPGDFNFSRIIPDTIRAGLLDKTLLIRSNGRFIRDYIFIDDVIEGYILLVEKIEKLSLYGEAFNFSNEKPISVLNLVKKIYSLLGKKPKYKILNQARYEINRQYLDSSKAKQILGWRPKYSLEKGLNITIQWYKSYFENERYK